MPETQSQPLSDEKYPESIRRLLTFCAGNSNESFLILCAGCEDVLVAGLAGLKNVKFSNLGDPDTLAKQGWLRLDAEQIDQADDSFDYVIEHWGLHHCVSPHRAILEMLRVSRKGILFIEPKDNWFTRLGVALKYGQEYELRAVAANRCVEGGVRNTEIPNYVYRFSKHEVLKTVKCAYPAFKIELDAFSHLRIPASAFRSSGIKRLALSLAAPILNVMGRLFPILNNQLVVAIRKPVNSDIQPWVRLEAGALKVDTDYLGKI